MDETLNSSTSTLESGRDTPNSANVSNHEVVCDETTLEEKYNKLKLIALKLKKKVVEQTDEIDKLREENVKVLGKTQKVSTIQQEFDKAQDEIERLRKLQNTLEKDLKSSVEENIKLKESNFEFQTQIQSLTSSHKFLREKCEKLEKSEEELLKWKTKAEELENGLKEAKQTELNAMQEKRQTTMLSLEITDYEKKLQDISETLDEARRQNENQAVLAGEADNKITSLEQTITKLEGTIEDLNRSRTQQQNDVARKNEKISFLQDEITKLNDKLAEAKSELTILNKEYDNCKLSFSTESRSLSEKCSNLEKIISNQENKISSLEENKRSRESFVSNLKLELHQLETEFSNYKLKAQAMLKSQRPSIPNSKDSDELENLQKIVQEFHSEISILKSDYQTLKLENESLTMERAELGVQLNQLKADAIEKEISLGNELHTFRQDLRQKDIEMKNVLETAKTDKETVIAAYKAKLQELKFSYESKIKGLEEEISNNMNNSKYSRDTESIFNISTLENTNDENNGIEKDKHHNPNFEQRREEPLAVHPLGASTESQTQSNQLTEPLSIDTSSMALNFDHFRMIPRGECEGSESISSSHLIQTASDNYNYNLTFEQLLSSDTKSSGSQPTTPVFGPNLKEELVRSQSQIKHLSTLLRESEANSERLAQLSEALKEEIRRVERDNQRKEHLKENTEYLKNVLLKFITLHGEDEKLRLIPVLETMLKLAPTEVVQLESSVKGDAHFNSDGNKAGTGWSSYLPLRWNN